MFVAGVVSSTFSLIAIASIYHCRSILAFPTLLILSSFLQNFLLACFACLQVCSWDAKNIDSIFFHYDLPVWWNIMVIGFGHFCQLYR
jgi:hypothetical protein